MTRSRLDTVGEQLRHAHGVPLGAVADFVEVACIDDVELRPRSGRKLTRPCSPSTRKKAWRTYGADRRVPQNSSSVVQTPGPVGSGFQEWTDPGPVLAREPLPVDPAGAVPPAVPGVPSRPGAQTSIRSALQDDAAGVPVSSPPSVSQGMPGDAVPVAVPELAVGEDREDLELVGCPGGRGRRRGERPAERFGLVPGAGREDTVDEAPIRVDPEQVDPAFAPGNGGDRSSNVRPPLGEELYSVGARERPRSSATHSSSRRTAAAEPRLRRRGATAIGRRRREGFGVGPARASASNRSLSRRARGRCATSSAYSVQGCMVRDLRSVGRAAISGGGRPAVCRGSPRPERRRRRRTRRVR